MATLRAQRVDEDESAVYVTSSQRLSCTPTERERDRAQALRALTGGQSTIYAMRLTDGTIKIGCTEHLDQRRRKFGPETEVLGFMPGDQDLEQAIHATIAGHRARGHEYYRPTAEVMAVVNDMRDHFGLPHLAS